MTVPGATAAAIVHKRRLPRGTSIEVGLPGPGPCAIGRLNTNSSGTGTDWWLAPHSPRRPGPRAATPRPARPYPAQSSRASAQSAWSWALPSPPSAITRCSCWAPVTSRSRGKGCEVPVRTGVVVSVRPSAVTEKVTEPYGATSSSMPTVAVNLLQLPPRKNATSLSVWVPSPLAWTVPRIVIGSPSPAACSPLEVSRSTGPQPLLLETNDRSLRYGLPVGGGIGTSVFAVPYVQCCTPPRT